MIKLLELYCDGETADMNHIESGRVRALEIAALAMLIALTGLFAGCAPRGNESSLKEMKSFEGGTAYRTSGDAYWVLTLNGTWRAMGRQYGWLVGDELRKFYDEISADLTSRGMNHDEQLESAKEWASGFSQDLNVLLKGIAETSGLSEDEVLILNAGMPNLTDEALGGEPPSVCSGLAAWGRYTPDGTLVFGRNWDVDRSAMERYMKYLSVVVFNPGSGNGYANVHPLGHVYLETGMNRRGLFIELNNGAASDPGYVEGRKNTGSVIATLQNRDGTLNEAATRLSETPADLSYILQVADAKEAVSVERPTFGARVRKGDQPGLLVAYNSFVPPYPQEWEGRLADPPADEVGPRYVNLVRLANSEEFYGKLNVDGMKRLMEVGIHQGGAMHDGTVHQVIAVPQELKLWIRGLGYSDWQQVDLKGLFKDS